MVGVAVWPNGLARARLLQVHMTKTACVPPAVWGTIIICRSQPNWASKNASHELTSCWLFRMYGVDGSQAPTAPIP